MAKIVWLILRKGAPGTTALDREQLQFSFTERQALNVLITQSRLHFDGNIVAAAQSIISACSNCPVTFVSDAAKIVAKDADVADPTSTSGRQASQGAAGGNRASRRRRKRNRKAGQTGAA
jgi:hypothetical protein